MTKEEARALFHAKSGFSCHCEKGSVVRVQVAVGGHVAEFYQLPHEEWVRLNHRRKYPGLKEARDAWFHDIRQSADQYRRDVYAATEVS